MSDPTPEKPKYRVPTMTEIEAGPKNGYRAVSTFSGCGGSCLGLRMAGFEILWASEFVDAAAAVYAANHPTTILDRRDIRTVDAGEILAATGLGVGDLDLLEGSPPCAGFSTAGKRAASWGRVETYSDTKQRVDDLFFEFARLVDGVRPRAFVAENVSGLIKGVAKGYFKEILRALRRTGYRVEVRLLDAQWLGVPQARQRLIFVGVRDDLEIAPAFPKPLPYRYSIRDALPQLAAATGRTGPGFKREAHPLDEPIGTIQASDPNHTRWEVAADEPACGWSLDTKSVDEVGRRADLDLPAPTVLTHGRSRSAIVVETSPSLDGYAIGAEWDKLVPGEQSARYFNLIRTDPEKPCPTVTGQGGPLNAATVTHPFERRKFTIAELRRLCGFPDDFVLLGTYAQQWERLGRAVPPPMMAAVGRAVADVLRTVDSR